MRSVLLGDFLTEQQIQHAIFLYENREGNMLLVKRLEEEVIRPNMDEINRKLGQENDARYLAYALLWALQQQEQ